MQDARYATQPHVLITYLSVIHLSSIYLSMYLSIYLLVYVPTQIYVDIYAQGRGKTFAKPPRRFQRIFPRSPSSRSRLGPCLDWNTRLSSGVFAWAHGPCNPTYTSDSYMYTYIYMFINVYKPKQVPIDQTPSHSKHQKGHYQGTRERPYSLRKIAVQTRGRRRKYDAKTPKLLNF